MAILDAQNLFSEAQSITAAAASSNVIDLGKDFDLGPGHPVGLLAQIVETFNNLTNLKIGIQTSTDEAFTSPVTLVEITLLLADLKAGKQLPIRFMPHGTKRFLRLYYTPSGTAPTTGKITAGLSSSQQDFIAYPSGFTV